MTPIRTVIVQIRPNHRRSKPKLVAIGAKIGEYIGFSDLKTLAIIFICAFGWEVVEFFWDGGVKGMINIYGSLERWAYDSLGDVAGAMLSAIIVVI